MPIANGTCGLVLFIHHRRTGGTSLSQALATVAGSCGSSITRATACKLNRGWVYTGCCLGSSKCFQKLVHAQHWAPHLLSTTTREERKFLADTSSDNCLGPRQTRFPEGYQLPPLNRTRMALEYHSHNWPALLKTMPILPRLRKLYLNHGCTFVSFTIVRAPLQLLISDWAYFGAGSSLDEYVACNGEPQSRRISIHAGLLRGPAPVCRIGSGARGAGLLGRQFCAQGSAAASWLELAKQALSSLDLIGVFENMEETVRLLEERTGMAGLLRAYLSLSRDHTRMHWRARNVQNGALYNVSLLSHPGWPAPSLFATRAPHKRPLPKQAREPRRGARVLHSAKVTNRGGGKMALATKLTHSSSRHQRKGFADAGRADSAEAALSRVPISAIGRMQEATRCDALLYQWVLDQRRWQIRGQRTRHGHSMRVL